MLPHLRLLLHQRPPAQPAACSPADHHAAIAFFDGALGRLQLALRLYGADVPVGQQAAVTVDMTTVLDALSSAHERSTQGPADEHASVVLLQSDSARSEVQIVWFSNFFFVFGLELTD